MFKFIFIIPLMGMLSIFGCGKNKTETLDHAPGMEPYKAPKVEEIPAQLIGDWERCEVNPKTKKSIQTKINLGSAIEIRETIFDDEFCQLINSTKESSTVSYYYFEKSGSNLKAKIQERKIIFYKQNIIDSLNNNGFCGREDWAISKTKDILGLYCLGMPRVSKYDYFNFNILSKSKKLVFNNLNYRQSKTKKPDRIHGPENLINPTNSVVMAEPGTRDVMLVYPPKREKFQIEIRTKFGTNLDQCDALSETYDKSLNSLERIKVMRNEIENLKTNIKDLKTELNNSVSEMIDFVEKNNLQEYDHLVRKDEVISEQLENYEVEYRGCRDNCKEILSEIKKLKEERNEIQKMISNQKISKKLKNDYKSYLYQIDLIDNKILEQKESIQAKDISINKELESYQKIFNKFSKIQGPLSHIHFKSAWEENIKILIKENPKLRFRPASINKVIMNYKMINLPHYPATGGILGLPDQEAKALVKGRIGFPYFPKSIEGRVNTSLLIACPAYRPEDFGLKTENPEIIEFEAEFNFKE
jgi:hypothetical protein